MVWRGPPFVHVGSFRKGPSLPALPPNSCFKNPLKTNPLFPSTGLTTKPLLSPAFPSKYFHVWFVNSWNVLWIKFPQRETAPCLIAYVTPWCRWTVFSWEDYCDFFYHILNLTWKPTQSVHMLARYTKNKNLNVIGILNTTFSTLLFFTSFALKSVDITGLTSVLSVLKESVLNKNWMWQLQHKHAWSEKWLPFYKVPMRPFTWWGWIVSSPHLVSSNWEKTSRKVQLRVSMHFL